jgi:hypothetical protein
MAKIREILVGVAIWLLSAVILYCPLYGLHYLLSAKPRAPHKIAAALEKSERGGCAEYGVLPSTPAWPECLGTEAAVRGRVDRYSLASLTAAALNFAVLARPPFTGELDGANQSTLSRPLPTQRNTPATFGPDQ